MDRERTISGYPSEEHKSEAVRGLRIMRGHLTEEVFMDEVADTIARYKDEVERLRAALKAITERVEKAQRTGGRLSPLTEELEAIAYRAWSK